MDRPTPIMAAIVPTPMPTIRPAASRPSTQVAATQPTSNTFFAKPWSRPSLSATAVTMPSPGLGTSFMFTVMAAPAPVKKMAASNRPKLAKNPCSAAS